MNKREIDVLLGKIREGDNKAFEYLYDKTKKGVYSFIYTYMKNPMDTEDVLQTVYMKIKSNIHQYKAGSNGLGWILQIAKNTALNELRALENYHKPLQITDWDFFPDKNKDCREKSILYLMKRVLTEEEQQIIILHVIWEYRHKDIATILNLPLGTVTSKYKRAKEKVAKAWKEEEQ